MTLSDRELALMITATDAGASATVNRVAGSVNSLSGGLRGASLRMFAWSSAAETVGRGMVRFGLVTTAAAVGAGKAFMDFGHEMALANTQAQMSQKQFERTSDAVLKISNRFGIAGTEIAQGLYDIYSTSDARGKEALKSVTQFAKAATAGGAEIRTVTRGVIDIQNAFGESAGSTNKVLNLQFKMLRESGGTYDELVSAFGNVIGAAKQTNQELETVSGAIAFLTERGRTQAQASISVSRALDQVSKSAGDIKKVLGVAVFDAEGNFRQLNDIITDMAAEMKGMTDQERVKAFEKMFGAGSIQANRFFRTAVLQADDLNEKIIDVAKNQGELNTQLDVVKKMDPSLTFKKLVEQIKNLGISLASDLWPAVQDIVKEFRSWLQAFNDLSPGTKELIAKITVLGGIFSLVGGKILLMVGSVLRLVSIFKLAGRTTALTTAIQGVGTASATSATKVGLFGKALSGLKGIATGALAIGGAVLAEQFIENAFDAATFDSSDLADKILPQSKVDDIENQLNSRMGHLTLTELNPFSNLSEKTADASAAYKQVIGEAVKAGIPLLDAQRALDEVWDESLQSLGGLNGGIGEFTDKLRTALGLVDGANDKVRRLSTSYLHGSEAVSDWNSVTVGTSVANTKAGDTIATLINAYGRYRGELNRTTAKQLNNLLRLGDTGAAIRLLREEYKKATKNVSENTGQTDKNMAAAQKASHAQHMMGQDIGRSAKEAENAKRKTDDYTGAINKVPKQCRTKFAAETATALADIARLKAAALALGDTVVHIPVTIGNPFSGSGGGGGGGGSGGGGGGGGGTGDRPVTERRLADTISITTHTDAKPEDVAEELWWAMKTRGW